MPKRKVFYSFYYDRDNWRASQVRNMGKLEGNAPVSDNDWEEVTNGSDKKIEKWINDQMFGRSCVVVLAGQKTANRKWINYELKQAWAKGKGLVGICIHGLKDSGGSQDFKGSNPFADVTVTKADGSKEKLSNIFKLKSGPYTASTSIYNHIKDNIEDWIEEAIEIRNKY
ncbi:TIR domain-containing protein [Halodesulfovibrio aestuarii]|uniref:TIR domain-containing protein n=1 Tax=Halodesulfovibrio aestuarii TaxID=126333 RepID=UPI003D349B58